MDTCMNCGLRPCYPILCAGFRAFSFDAFYSIVKTGVKVVSRRNFYRLWPGFMGTLPFLDPRLRRPNVSVNVS